MPEQSLCAMEQRTGLRITVIDHDGIFRGRQKNPIFAPERASHKKHPVCAIGFCGKCIQNCRFDMNVRCMKNPEPFAPVCWKGVRQLVFPLYRDRIHYGMFYVGAWRTPEGIPKRAVRSLPDAFFPVYEALPLFPEEEVPELKAIFSIFSEGVLERLIRTNRLSEMPDFRQGKIRDFMNAHLADRQYGLPDLAAFLNLSVPYTSSMVGRLFGVSYSELLNQYRVERAKHYLAGTELKLNQISVLCGFSSEFHLGKVFRSRNGISPGRWRKKIWAENIL